MGVILMSDKLGFFGIGCLFVGLAWFIICAMFLFPIQWAYSSIVLVVVGCINILVSMAFPISEKST